MLGDVAAQRHSVRSPAPSSAEVADDGKGADFTHWAKYPPSSGLPVILQHSSDAFVENGYHGTTVRDIAKRLGQTVPAIYYHYENKQAVLVALLNLSMDELLARCEAADADGPQDPRSRLSRLVRCIVFFVAYRRDMALLDAEIRSLEPRNRAAYVQSRDRMQAMVTRVITAGMERGDFAPGDSHAHARAVLTLLRGIANWYRQSGTFSSDDLADQYVTYVFRLVGAVRPPSDPS
jgi:AcrR family transcriptional regulator